MKRIIALLFTAAVLVSAQTTTGTSAFSVGLGGGYNASGYNGAGSTKAAVLIDFNYQPNPPTVSAAGSPIWFTTTLVTQPGKASGINTVRAGIGYSLKKSGNWNLIALADGGATTTNTATLGNLGGGLKLRYDLGGLSKNLAGIGIEPSIRIAAISGTSVTPEYTLSVSKHF